MLSVALPPPLLPQLVSVAPALRLREAKLVGAGLDADDAAAPLARKLDGGALQHLHLHGIDFAAHDADETAAAAALGDALQRCEQPCSLHLGRLRVHRAAALRAVARFGARAAMKALSIDAWDVRSRTGSARALGATAAPPCCRPPELHTLRVRFAQAPGQMRGDAHWDSAQARHLPHPAALPLRLAGCKRLS